MIDGSLNIRWLGRVGYGEAWDLQRALYAGGDNAGENSNHLLLLEHPPVYTFGRRGDRSHLLAEPAEIRAEEFWVDRGGDVTFHGPGQLVGYPILSLGGNGNGMLFTAKYVRELEDLLMEVLDELGVRDAHRREKYPGIWIEGNPPKKIASIGIKLNRGRTMHGFGLNVSTDLSWFENIMPCGIPGIEMTSIARELDGAGPKEFRSEFRSDFGKVGQKVKQEVEEAKGKEVKEKGKKAKEIKVKEVAELVAQVAERRWASGEQALENGIKNQNRENGIKVSQAFTSQQPIKIKASQTNSLKTNSLKINERKPEWLRAPVRYSENYSRLKVVLKDLPTVCESAGCPNLYECWGAGTATFMINGDRCTRNCGFCLVDTQKPLPPDIGEPERLAKAVKTMGLKYVVITAVARDDLADGGAGGFVESIREVRDTCPGVGVEVLIPDFKGRPDLLDLVFQEKPDVLNHNIETILRLQREVRPQAGYARSLAVLARAKMAGLRTKSSIMVGLGETMDEVKEALADLAGVGTDIVTIGQYLRPSADHLPVSRWWLPEEFQELSQMAEELNITHIEAGPLVRSSYMAGNVKSKAEV